jgi:nitrogen fixation-related uncharacterized protein
VFYAAWLTLIAAGVGASIAALFWALKTGQFSDQGRARYLPLTDEIDAPPAADARRLPSEVYALSIIIIIGLLSIASTITLTIYWLQR